MTRPEAARLVRERWERLGMSPEEAPHVFSSDVDNMLEEVAPQGVAGSLCGKVGHATTNTAIQPHAKACSRRRVRTALLAAANVANPESSALGVAIDADVPQGSQVLEVADQGRGTTPSTESITVGDSGVSTSARVDAPGIHSSLDHFTNRITRCVDKKLGRETEGVCQN